MKARYVILFAIVFLTGLCLLLALYHLVDMTRPITISVDEFDDKSGVANIVVRSTSRKHTSKRKKARSYAFQPQDSNLPNDTADAPQDSASAILSLPNNSMLSF